MDLKHIGLFEGIGGFSLAAEWQGWETIAMCEILPFAQKVLKHHFPNSILHGDIKTTDFTIYRGKCDILTGGFPCQGFSVAGLRLGTDDNRYLWPEYLRAIDEIQPPFVLGENVTGILSMEDKSGVYRDVFAKVESRKVTRLCEIDDYKAVYTRQSKMLVNSICESLEARGYEVQTFAVPAASVGAPHKRERIWFVAAHTGRIAGRRRREGEQSGNSINNRQNDGWQEKTDQPERSYQTWPDTETQSEWRSHADIFRSPEDHEPITDPDSINRRPGQSGQSGQSNGQELGEVSDPSVANSVGNRGRESMRDGQSELINENGKKRRVRNDADTSGTGRKELITPGLAASPGHSAWRNPQNWNNWPTQSPICTGDDGISPKLDGITFPNWRNESIKGAGNAVVPQVVIEFYKAIEQYITETNEPD